MQLVTLLTNRYGLMLQVSLFFTKSPTSPFLRCVDIELVSKLYHAKGTVVCIEGMFATPLNQKALALVAHIILHSATKYLGGHNDDLSQAKRAKYGILDNLVRFSFGDEDYEDLEADVLKALEAI
ncbi:putative cystathionine gamma-synthase [Helianthus annuus]|nr:putative cystathionine gamma-synthase [Helianthus annuus]